MNKLSYEEVIKIFDGANFQFISVSKNGVFISSEGLDEKAPEYAIIREMAYNHPNKDTTKPLFTFPCTINELRDFLHDNDESCQLSGVIYIDKGKKYTASEVIDLMVEATVLETSLLPDDEKMGVFSQQYKKQFLDDHQLLKNDYQESMTQYLKLYSITVLGDETEQKLKDISLENIMDDVINWLQGERFAVFANDSATSIQNLTQENERIKQQLPVADTPKATRTRKDPVREAMESIITTNPTVNKAEMWAELQKLARSGKPPFVDEQDEHTLIYVAGGAAKTDIKKLTKEQADTRLISYKTK